MDEPQQGRCGRKWCLIHGFNPRLSQSLVNTAFAQIAERNIPLDDRLNRWALRWQESDNGR